MGGVGGGATSATTGGTKYGKHVKFNSVAADVWDR